MTHYRVSDFTTPAPESDIVLAAGNTADLEQRTEAHLRDWCAQRGLDYESLSEDEFATIVAEGLKQVRKNG